MSRDHGGPEHVCDDECRRCNERAARIRKAISTALRPFSVEPHPEELCQDTVVALTTAAAITILCDLGVPKNDELVVEMAQEAMRIMFVTLNANVAEIRESIDRERLGDVSRN